MQRIRKVLTRLRKKLRYLRLAFVNLGPASALRYWAKKLVRNRGSNTPRPLTSKYLDHPVCFRPRTTDLAVFQQIFVEREYGCLDDVTGPDLVIDCGANVGYSSAYFLSRFPGSELIAVEPDPGNFRLLSKNLAPYGDRVTLVESGVWSHPARLCISETGYGGGGEWGVQVRECTSDAEPGFQAVDIESLLARSGRQRISILKIDIEGAEGVVFASNYRHWLDRVDCLVIELHDDSSFGNCSQIFAQAIDGQNFIVSEWGELTVCKRRLTG
ncbi:MAG: FkbM family methyltransferase [Gammaproteobacteria bacterium]